MRIFFALLVMAALIAATSFWHGATGSPLSKTACQILPLLPTFGLLIGVTRQKS